MRTTDPDPAPWRPLGERVQPRKAEANAEPAWQAVPESPGIERERSTGRMRTALPTFGAPVKGSK